MNHLWPLMTHSSPSWYARASGSASGRSRRPRARSSRSTTAPMPSHSGLQVLLLLLVGAPVQQRVHVALVGRLAVERRTARSRVLAASACTMASSTWPRPMPPHSSGMCGSHRPRSLRRRAHLDDGRRCSCLRSSLVRSRFSMGRTTVVDERRGPGRGCSSSSGGKLKSMAMRGSIADVRLRSKPGRQAVLQLPACHP